MSPPFSGIHQDHQPFPQMWLVAVNRTAFARLDHSGLRSANSRESRLFTPFQRLQHAAMGCALLVLSQPFLRARIAATPEASTTHRARSVPAPPASSVQWTVCTPPSTSSTSLILTGRSRLAPSATARERTSSSRTARSTWYPGKRTLYFGPVSLQSASPFVLSLKNQNRMPCFTRCFSLRWSVSPSTRPRKKALVSTVDSPTLRPRWALFSI